MQVYNSQGLIVNMNSSFEFEPDSFASGLVYGLITTGDVQKAVNYGAAHGALAMTTPGDTSMANLKEVEGVMKGAGARVQR